MRILKIEFGLVLFVRFASVARANSLAACSLIICMTATLRLILERFTILDKLPITLMFLMISRLTFRVGDVLGAAALPPDLPRYVLSTARLKHYKTAHAKRKIDSAKVQKERAKQARENPGGNPLHEARRRAKSASLAEKLARILPDPTIGGHNLKIIRPKWEQWPTTSTTVRAGTLLTCTLCWRASNQDWETSPCIGRQAPSRFATKALWKRLYKGREQ